MIPIKKKKPQTPGYFVSNDLIDELIDMNLDCIFF